VPWPKASDGCDLHIIATIWNNLCDAPDLYLYIHKPLFFSAKAPYHNVAHIMRDNESHKNIVYNLAASSVKRIPHSIIYNWIAVGLAATTEFHFHFSIIFNIALCTRCKSEKSVARKIV